MLNLYLTFHSHSCAICNHQTFFQVFLIEILGRRTLMLYGVGGMCIFFTFLTSMFCFEVKFNLLAWRTEISDKQKSDVVLLLKS